MFQPRESPETDVKGGNLSRYRLCSIYIHSVTTPTPDCSVGNISSHATASRNQSRHYYYHATCALSNYIYSEPAEMEDKIFPSTHTLHILYTVRLGWVASRTATSCIYLAERPLHNSVACNLLLVPCYFVHPGRVATLTDCTRRTMVLVLTCSNPHLTSTVCNYLVPSFGGETHELGGRWHSMLL
jgi:hypothetical protein